MCFVYGEQRQPQARQSFQRSIGKQPLWRDVQQVKLLLDQFARDAAGFCRIQIGMQCAGRYTKLTQRSDLIVH
jgi:hypothetical protein